MRIGIKEFYYGGVNGKVPPCRFDTGAFGFGLG